MDDFILRALLAGVGIALTTGPLGAFVIWRRMAYFGNAISHSALLGVAIALLIDIDTTIGVIVSCIGLACFLLLSQQQYRQLTDDTLLSVVAHGAMGIGMIILSFMERVRVDLMGYLFGDILAVSLTDLLWIYGSGIVTLAIIVGIWRPLLSVTVHEELAKVESNFLATSVQTTYVLLLALYIALAIKAVGMLLITTLLVVPAATARRFATTPEAMAVFSTVIGTAVVVGGLSASVALDTPSGPTIVATALVLFIFSLLWRDL